LTLEVACVDFTNAEVEILEHLLCPYKANLHPNGDAADLIICRSDSLTVSRPAIRISRQQRPDRVSEITGEKDGTVDLSHDLIGECLDRFKRVMEPGISLKYRLITKPPVRYNIVPSRIRSKFLKAQKIDADLSKHIANEIARGVLKRAFSLLGFPLQRKRPPELLITHDIDSDRGFRKAEALRSVEDDLGIASTWFLPSDEYPLRRSDAGRLGEMARIGSHDTKHDGKLIHIRSHDRLVERLRRSRLRLETVFERRVNCFRSPLMQFSRRILRALHEAGYESDFSVPCWEPVNPTTMSGFGIESAMPFEIDRVMEHPLTVFQDHQVLFVLGMGTREAVKLWIDQCKLLRALGGDIVILVHPDYAFSQDLKMYSLLLRSLLEVHEQSDPN
jgi:hypothetical protein